MDSPLTMNERELRSAIAEARMLRDAHVRGVAEAKAWTPPRVIAEARTLLILEDEVAASRMLDRAVRHAGYAPLVIHSIGAAWQLLKDPTYIISRAVIDWLINGECARSVLAALVEFGVTTCVFTGYPGDTELLKWTDRGVTIIAKPDLQGVIKWLETEH